MEAVTREKASANSEMGQIAWMGLKFVKQVHKHGSVKPKQPRSENVRLGAEFYSLHRQGETEFLKSLVSGSNSKSSKKPNRSIRGPTASTPSRRNTSAKKGDCGRSAKQFMILLHAYYELGTKVEPLAFG